MTHPSIGTAHKAGNLEHTAQPAGSSTGCDSNLNFFYVACLVSASSRQLLSEWFLAFFSSESLLCHLAYVVREGLSVFIVYCGRHRPSESSQFWVLPEHILRCLPSCLKEPPARWNVSNLEETGEYALILSFLPSLWCSVKCVVFHCLGKIGGCPVEKGRWFCLSKARKWIQSD